MTSTVPGVTPTRAPHYLSTLPRTMLFDAGPGLGEWDDHVLSQPGVLSWISEVAEGPSALPHLTLARTAGLMRWDRPRGLSWGEYPVVSDLRVRLPADEATDCTVFLHGEGRPRKAYSVGFARALAAATSLVVSLFSSEEENLPEASGRRLARIHALVSSLREDAPDVILLRTGEAPETMTFEGFGALVAPWSAHERFDFSYGVNAGVILGRALRESAGPACAACRDMPVRLVRGDDLGHDTGLRLLGMGYFGSMFEPLTLQVLYRLRRLGEVRAPRPLDEDGPHVAALAGGPRDLAGRLTWHGTGRYEPAVLAGANWPGIGRSLWGPLRFGLVDLHDETLSLSACGAAFLDMLHPDNEDPDMPLRWRGPANADARASMDDWILRNFRKMANRIDATASGGR